MTRSLTWLRLPSALLLTAFAALAASGCTAAEPETPSSAAVQTVPLRTLAANIGPYIGQTVQVCGRWNGPRNQRTAASSAGI